MLEAMGATVTVDGLTVELERTASLAPLDIDVPGDFSAAAFWLVAAGVVSESKAKLVCVGGHPTRTALAGLPTTAGFHLARPNPRLEAREPAPDPPCRPPGRPTPL